MFHQLTDRILSLFLRSNCPLCDRSAEDILCRYCHRQLEDCQLTQPDRAWQTETPLFAWGKYEGALKQSIAKLKYGGQQSIGDLCGELLAQSWLKSTPTNLPTKLIIVPIPLHLEKLTTRGFNQAELIARRFCQLTGHKLDLSLQRNRSTVAQFGLSRSARQENVAGAFTLAPKSTLTTSSTVLLIDDIYTTGATIRSATATLQSRNIQVCGVATIAAGLSHLASPKSLN